MTKWSCQLGIDKLLCRTRSVVSRLKTLSISMQPSQSSHYDYRSSYMKPANSPKRDLRRTSRNSSPSFSLSTPNKPRLGEHFRFTKQETPRIHTMRTTIRITIYNFHCLSYPFQWTHLGLKKLYRLIVRRRSRQDLGCYETR